MPRTVVGLYDDIGTARKVVHDLVDDGFNRHDMSIVAYDPEGAYAPYFRTERAEPSEPETADAAEGAGIGAMIGGFVGLLVGLAAVAIPGVGPIVAAGSIATALVGAGVGAAAGGLIRALVNVGVPEEEVEHYVEGIRRGGTLVIAQVHNDRVDEATEIIERDESVDVKRRSARWRKQGWTGYDPDAVPYTPGDINREREHWRTQTVGPEAVRKDDARGTDPAWREAHEALRVDDQEDDTYDAIGSS